MDPSRYITRDLLFDRASITVGERRLLDQLEKIYAQSAMPPGTIPNPTKKKIRPSSASAKVQTHPNFHTGLFDNTRPSTAVSSVGQNADITRRPKTQAGGPRFWSKAQTDTCKEDIVKPRRRLTVGPTDGIADTDAANRQTVALGLGKVLKGRIEEKINIDALESLKQAFVLCDEDGSGQLELDEFKELLKTQLNIPNSKDGQIDALFQKIDWSSEGAITWDEFCTYMQLEYAEKEDSYLRGKEVAFHLPAKIKNMPHREPVLRVTDTPDGNFLACSQDGLTSTWSPNMELKRTRTVQPSALRKTRSSLFKTSETPGQKSSKTKWITDFTIMSHFNKFVVGTGDREIQFFELSSFEPYCQINSLETVPLRLDYCLTGPDECIILFGDSEGCINIIVVTSAGECLRTWKQAPKAEGIASVGIDVIAGGEKTKFIRWKVHGDWVQQLQYHHEIRQVISCSNHSNTALVIGCTMGSTDVSQQLKDIKDTKVLKDKQDQKAKDKEKEAAQNKIKMEKDMRTWTQPKPRLDADQNVFKVYKGVKCFAFSKNKNIIVTGGMDRIVRMWNPYVSGKCTGMLRGHSAPIFYLFIAEEENRIFSISTDKCIKVWDIQDQNCLLTVRPKGHKIRGDLQACHYSNISKTLAVATDQINGLPLKLKPVLHADIPITHKEPIHAVVYNPSFKQVITCSDGSTIKLWDFESGSPIFEYGEAHGESAITCMTFDSTGRRLITGARDGCIRIWNYNNGHCLRSLLKESDNEEVCSLQYVEMNKNRYVVAVGWDKRINIYSDSADSSTIHHVQHPQPKWSDDLADGHKEDILSVAQCPPNLLATSSYDGEVIVWNMVSGHIFCHLRAPPPPGYQDQTLDGDRSINTVVFLKTRSYSKEAASLVASGPYGGIHFWNVFHGGALLAQFSGSKMPGALITAMEVIKNNTILFCADNFGFLYAWNIEGYCMQKEDEGPELLTTWRGHVDNCTAITVIEEQKMVLTASLDCTVRLWTFDGEYVGTFGQPDPWDVYNFATFQHPMVPYDVLVDPLSLPDHPIIAEKQNISEIIHMDSARNSDDEEEQRVPSPSVQAMATGKYTFFKDDDSIAEDLKKKPYANGTGKRLRHEKLKPVRVERGGPSEYQMLKCYDLDPTPQPKEPQLTMNRNDPFDFYGNENEED